MADIPGFYIYRRLGFDQRILELRAGGRIGRGNARLERHWRLQDQTLSIDGEEGVICSLTFSTEIGGWQGKWAKYKGMPIELLPTLPVDESAKQLKKSLVAGEYGLGDSQATLAFGEDGDLAGLDGFKYWAVSEREQTLAILFFGEKNCEELRRSSEENSWENGVQTVVLKFKATAATPAVHPCSVLQPALFEAGIYKGGWSFNLKGRGSNPSAIIGKKGVILDLESLDPADEFSLDLQLVEELVNRMEWDWSRLSLLFQYQISGSCSALRCYWVSSEGARVSHYYWVDLTEGVKGWKSVSVSLKAAMGDRKSVV